MNEYNDLMNEYEDLKNETNKEIMNISNIIIMIKSFNYGLDLFKNKITVLPDYEQKSEIYKKIEKNSLEFTKKISFCKNLLEDEIVSPLSGLFESTNEIFKMKINKFDDIKISLIQSRQKLNKTKDNYFNFISKNNKSESKNKDENLLYNAKKENYYELYKYEVNQMNNVIEENNIQYTKLYNEIWGYQQLEQQKLKNFMIKFSEYISKIGDILKEFSKCLIDEIKDEINLGSNFLKNKISVKEKRFEKVKIIENIPINKNNDRRNKSENNNIKFNNREKKNNKENKKNEENKLNHNNNNINQKNNDNKTNLFDEFEIIEEDLYKNQKDKQIENEKLIDEIINKLMNEEELLTQEIYPFMNLLKLEDPSTQKLYSYTFLTKLAKCNKKYIINLKNGKNFVHLSNILNDISINENKIEILKLIIDISQIITYKDFHLFNILQKKNKYFTTKTFWCKIIYDSFFEDLNSKIDIILNTNNNTKSKEKEMNYNFILEKNKFANKVNNYKKLNIEQKLELDKYAKNDVKNILTRIIEGMCSFLVEKNVIMEVINDFGKNFDFNSNNIKYYKLLMDVYMNRNYIYNLKQLPLKEKNTYANSAKICIISNASKFILKKDLINLLILEKSMTEHIKLNIFKNILNQKLSIDERIRIWGLMLNIEKLEKEYNYEEEKEKIMKLIENKEIKKGTKMHEHLEMIKLDVNRTYFKNKKDSKPYQEKIKNILITLINIFKDIGYSQGMNYIAAFFYQIFEYNEKKTFYFMLAVEKNSKFKDIFKNDLYKLQIFFKIFEKILKINIPELYQHQTNNNINPNFYAPPWFLTLFTYISTIFEKENAPEFILLVIENFLLNGWSAIMNAGYTIMKYLKNDMLQMKGDILMTYLVNKFGQDKIINKENFDSLKSQYIKNSYIINDSLIAKLIKLEEYERKKEKNLQNLFVW